MDKPSLKTLSAFNSNSNSNSNIFNSNPVKDDQDEEGKKEAAAVLRSRPRLKDFPKLEEVNSKYKDVIVTLPKGERWLVTDELRNYKGYWQSELLLPGIMAMEEVFQPRHGDVIIASFPKSGTTWLKALSFTLMHRNKYPNFSSHPLLELNPHDCVPFIEFQYAARDEQYLETLPSPRVLGTHQPYSILPESIKTSKCPIVYICREPKDVLVSLWHMVTRIDWVHKESLPFTQAFQLFCEGRMPFGPVWDHVLEYYNKSLHPSENILFLRYEEMMKNPINGVVKLANFIGCPFSEEEIKNGLVEEIVDFCSFNKLKDLDINKKSGGSGSNKQNDFLFRKAVVGDWKNHMTPEMAIKLDEITKQKLHNSDFTY